MSGCGHTTRRASSQAGSELSGGGGIMEASNIKPVTIQSSSLCLAAVLTAQILWVLYQATTRPQTQRQDTHYEPPNSAHLILFATLAVVSLAITWYYMLASSRFPIRHGPATITYRCRPGSMFSWQEKRTMVDYIWELGFGTQNSSKTPGRLSFMGAQDSGGVNRSSSSQQYGASS